MLKWYFKHCQIFSKTSNKSVLSKCWFFLYSDYQE